MPVMPEDQIRRILELANGYYAPVVKLANQSLSLERFIKPQLQRLTRQVREFEDYPRYLLIKSFTFARGGWHDAPLMAAPARGVQSMVMELADKPDEEVKARLDREFLEYFRKDDHAALRGMIEQWDLLTDWRRRVVEDAFDAHKGGKYTLSVPTLAPQIEGMLRELTGEYEGNALHIQKVNEALEFSYSRNTPPSAPTAEKLEEALEELLDLEIIPERYQEAERISLHHALFRVNELYNRVDFADLDFADSANRHAVLHGVAKDYGELASVKLFCAVQLVHEIAEAYREATPEDQE